MSLTILQHLCHFPSLKCTIRCFFWWRADLIFAPKLWCWKEKLLKAEAIVTWPDSLVKECCTGVEGEFMASCFSLTFFSSELQICSQQTNGYCFKSGNMASVHILIIFAVIGGQAGYAGSEFSLRFDPLPGSTPFLKPPFSFLDFVTLQVAPEVNGQCGQTSVLKCIINISKDVEKPEITLIKWTKEDNEEPLLNYLSGDLKTMPGYSLAQKSWKSDFDVSLSINNITLQHEGEYTCEVVVNNAHKMEKSRLKVTRECP